MLSKLGGEVDFEADGGCGWAQAILPLRLLLFYKVAYMFIMILGLRYRGGGLANSIC